MSSLNVEEVLTKAWSTFKAHWHVLVGSVLIMMAVSAVFDSVQKQVGESAPFASFLVVLLSIGVSVILQIGLTQLSLNVASNKSASIHDLIGDHTLALRYLCVSILYGLLILVGLVLLIVPGVYWAIKYSQCYLTLIDKRTGIMESFRISAALTEGNKKKLFVLLLALIGINFVGLIALIVGLLVSIPVTIVASAYIYIYLRDAHGATPGPDLARAPTGEFKPLGAPSEPSVPVDTPIQG